MQSKVSEYKLWNRKAMSSSIDHASSLSLVACWIS